MRKVFADLPDTIKAAILDILTRQENPSWVDRAVALHERYTERKKGAGYIRDAEDALAYLALRVPATYAQLYGALAAIQETIPSWQPKTVLDIGGGPGVGTWAAKSIWPSIEKATVHDQEANLITFGKQIEAASGLAMDVTWDVQDVRKNAILFEQYDLVIIANVLNELSPSEGEKVLGQAFNATKGVLVVLEPGTPFGSGIIQSVARKLSKAGSLLAPYIGESLVASDNFWLHFPQRFIRPDFSRRIRQHMRDNSHMASDWEEAKYSYVAISKIPQETQAWGRVVGQMKIQKGFLELPVLTRDTIALKKVMKRDKEKYTLAKNLKWGDLIPTDITPTPKSS